MKIELKTCPFCGSDRITVWNIRDGQQAVCKECKSTGTPTFHGKDGRDATWGHAVEAWNRRAPLPEEAGSDDVIGYVLRYGGMCRDCADMAGVCQSGQPCDTDQRRSVIRHTIDALAYGIKHGFITNPFTAALAVQTQQGVEELKWHGNETRSPLGDLYEVNRLSENVWVTYKNGTPFHGWRPTCDEAKAAAQSDYETRIRSALGDVPAVESEPVAWLRSCRISFLSGEERDGHIVTDRNHQNAFPVYAHPPRSLSKEGGEMALKAKSLAASIIENFDGWEDDNGEEIPELQIARDILTLSTRKGSASTSKGCAE